MIEQNATVIQRQGEDALLEVPRQSSCGSCSSKGCGTGSLAKVFSQRPITMWVNNSIGAEVGEQVVIGISEQALVQGSVLTYILPLITLLLGGLTGDAIAGQTGAGGNELFTVIGAIAGFALGLLSLKVFNQGVLDQGRFKPVILRRTTANVGLHPITFQQNKS